MTTALAVMMLLVGSPEPARAGNGDWSRLVNHGWPNHCLDSNFAGDVYILPCSANNDHQRWVQWFGGWTKNVRTGLCLTLKPGWGVRTQACDQNNRYQYWYQWDGGWVKNPFDGVCISPDINRNMGIFGKRCALNDWAEHWDQDVF